MDILNRLRNGVFNTYQASRVANNVCFGTCSFLNNFNIDNKVQKKCLRLKT